VRLASGRDHVMLRAVLPVSGEEAHVTFSKEGLARLKAGLQRAGLDARYFAWPPANDPNRAPYRGLRPLEVEDAGIFFGRGGPIVEALDRLRGLREAAPPRLLVILGASGAGKSSFLRAGLPAPCAGRSTFSCPTSCPSSTGRAFRRDRTVGEPGKGIQKPQPDVHAGTTPCGAGRRR
jgi:hypothetical protein